MKIQRIFIALSLVNLGLMIFLLAHFRRAEADSVAPVLRGRALEIVDDRGQVRASITVFPADPSVKMPDGTTGYPETVLLRLINSKGRPNVKIEASEIGAGVMVGGESNPTYASLTARGKSTCLKLIDTDTRQQQIKP